MGYAEERVGVVETFVDGVARPFDLERAKRAVSELLIAFGVDLDDPNLEETPRRVAEAYAELLTPLGFVPTTFPSDGYDELVLVRDIPFHSLCSHHLLPFYGYAHVAYLPRDEIVGLSKIARVVEAYSRSLQVQERLTSQIANWFESHLSPRGVAVVIEAEHTCMAVRGIRKQGSKTITSSLLGSFRDDARSRSEFLALAGVGRM
jgi:GTP cyclohydrolase I